MMDSKLIKNNLVKIVSYIIMYVCVCIYNYIDFS